MQQIYYELSVLAKAIHFKNLSSAASHVGLSQPQLSRIIAKIEDNLKVVLLDRSAKRKSGWTPLAFQLADIFEKSLRRLQTDLHGISNNEMVAELHIGTLEGLADFAIKTCKTCFEKVGVKKIFVDIYDLNELEANFFSGNLDLIFTSKQPGKQKFKYITELGTQQLETIKTSSKYGVYSSFEYSRLPKRETQPYEHVLISNSLAIRKNWLQSVGGTGLLPTETRKGKNREAHTVHLIGSEILSPVLWQELQKALETV